MDPLQQVVKTFLIRHSFPEAEAASLGPNMSVWHVAHEARRSNRWDSEQSEMDDGLKETQNLR